MRFEIGVDPSDTDPIDFYARLEGGPPTYIEQTSATESAEGSA